MEIIKRIPYGVGDFEQLRKSNMYYVDKTSIIEKLEQYQYPFLIRPRRFGKSLLVSTLENYYDMAKENEFDELFDGLYIHEYPTSERNKYLILRLDFSGVETSRGKGDLFDSFAKNVKVYLLGFVEKYHELFSESLYQKIEEENEPAQMVKALSEAVKTSGKKMYLLIDEYDNFANDLIGANQDELYFEILQKTGFVRTFYEAIKSGAQEGAISRIFITGVSPIMLDDLTSGFNIASNVTLEEEFNTSLGFTQDEVEGMLETYWALDDEKYDKEQVLKEAQTYYNGYLFSEDSAERVYNPDMVLYFMRYISKGRYPREMVDSNIKTDYNKLQRILAANQMEKSSSGRTKFEEIYERDEIITRIKRMFSLEAIAGKEEIISLMYYMGMLTIDKPVSAAVKLKIPNLVIRELYWEYLYQKINHELGDILEIGEIVKRLDEMSKMGNPTGFVTYTYDKVLRYISNRDLIGMEEKHMKMIFLAFLSMNNLYIPYSELEMNGGYSDLALYPDSRYEMKNSHIWELKFLKKGDNREEKLKDAREQIKRYESDEKFLRLTRGTKLCKYIIIGTKDGVEIIEV